MSILIKNAEIISHSTNGIFNVYVDNNRIIEISKSTKKANNIIDAKGLILVPGVIDMHTHLREPGFEYKETIETGLSAAVHGGVTTIGIMPNTNPAMDNLEIIKFIENKANNVNLAKIIPIPSITKKRQGNVLNNLKYLSDNGYYFFSDDGNPIFDDEIMFNALKTVKDFNGIIINHCEDKRFLNIPLFESLMVARDIEIAKYTKGHLHIAHISTKNTVDLIKYAKRNKLNVSCEVTFHHLLLNNNEKNTLKKINPPLPNVETQRYLIENLDYIDIIVSDHAPHSLDEKNKSFDEAPNGISGLDVFLPAIFTLAKQENIDLKYLIEKVTFNPSKIFNLDNIGDIKEGVFADLSLVDSNLLWDNMIFSKGKNLPYNKLNGHVVLTLVNGDIKYGEVNFE
ncbi:dihydroorotase [Marinitoga arctica]